MTSRSQVEVELYRGVDVEEWRRRAAHGSVPGSTPYGLDGLAAHGYSTSFVSQPDAWPPRAIAAGAARRFGGGIDWIDGGRPGGQQSGVRLCWEERNGLPAALKSRRSEIDVVTGVIWITDHDQRMHPAVARLARSALAATSAVWSLSSAQIPVLTGDWGVRDSRAHHVLFGIDTEFWRQTSDAPDRVPGTVISTGNDRHRDHPTLLRAVRQLTEGGTSNTLTLITNQEIELGKHGQRIPHMDHVSLRREYARSSVCAIALKPNLHVSGMTAILEAQAMGLPVVCTRTPGLSDYVIEGETAILVPAGDADAFAAALRELLINHDRRAAMGAAGVDFVRDFRSSDLMVASLADLIGSLS